MNIRWPRFLTPNCLSQLIKHQKNPLTALRIFTQAKSRYPTYRHNGPVYATMIHVLGSSGRLTEMKHVIEEMKEEPCECKDHVFASAITTYAKAGLFDDAVSLFHSIPQFNCVSWTESFHTLLQLMVEQGKLKEAQCLYLENSQMWEVKTGTRSLKVIIDALCRRSRSDLGLQIFQEMNRQCCYPDRETYKILMKGLCDDGRFQDATHLLYSMFWMISQKGSGADIVVYRTLLEALCDNGKIGEAVEILGKVLKKGLKAKKSRCKSLDVSLVLECRRSMEDVKGQINNALVRGGVPSLLSYSAMVDDLYAEGKIGDADRLFDEMRERGFRPLVSTYEAKIAALCKEGRASEGAKVLEEDMVERDDCLPSVKAYNTVIRGLCSEAKSTRAVGLLEKMARQKGCIADKETYDQLVFGLCGEGRFVEAGRVLEKMLDGKCWPRAATLNTLINGLCLMDRRYEAVLWLEEMVSQGMTPQPFVWNALVAVVCSRAGGEEASTGMLRLLSLDLDS
eukprot:TRINITY_DN1726_c0_g1_i1.p1 TRINITY_DN1726_c0_g1~~TRINITY_DN1726_c0_g1_i1.p1  ORF type:complete len:509 (-),score=45.77 TRINITY_DN1726_c0_g1_i1:262-1788(-)